MNPVSGESQEENVIAVSFRAAFRARPYFHAVVAAVFLAGILWSYATREQYYESRGVLRLTPAQVEVVQRLRKLGVLVSEKPQRWVFDLRFRSETESGSISGLNAAVDKVAGDLSREPQERQERILENLKLEEEKKPRLLQQLKVLQEKALVAENIMPVRIDYASVIEEWKQTEARLKELKKQAMAIAAETPIYLSEVGTPYAKPFWQVVVPWVFGWIIVAGLASVFFLTKPQGKEKQDG